jgi:hypothetical protein
VSQKKLKKKLFPEKKKKTELGKKNLAMKKGAQEKRRSRRGQNTYYL